ncbi:MAG: thioredoxin fold domain-containing protein [Deltaproteobacteria bacterium]|nr:thioredoxin fold domain-containing protein [Deltaproteobacteria bacterium]MBN2671757.1 thioredoxin fold domain-containing protein [Deltaproteobacteria bacterium]
MGILNWLGLTGDCEKEPVELNDKNFIAEVRKSPIPVIVDVWSNGCAPCVQLAPTIKRLACKYEGKVKVAHLNIHNGMKSAQKLGVRGTPTVLFFKNGNVVERVVGVRGQHYFEEVIETELLDDATDEKSEKSA